MRREVAADALGGWEPVVAGAGEGPAAAVLADDVIGALAALPPEQRAVIVLRHLLGFSPGEIARTLGLPRGTVNSRLRRGLDGLTAPLEDHQP